MRRLRGSRNAGCACIALWLIAGCAGDKRDPSLDLRDGGPAWGIDGGRLPDGGLQPLPDAGKPPEHDGRVPDGMTDADVPPLPDGAVEPDAGPVLEPPPEALPPHRIGMLVGPGAEVLSPDLRVYGTDLGITFEHEGELQILFGDTWADEEQVCRDAPINDDTLGTLPLERTHAGVPALTFETRAEAPNEPRALRLLRGEQSLTMGFGQVPMAAFSDGQSAFAFFARIAPQACTDDASQPQCPEDEGLSCSDDIGECQPALTTMTLSCDLVTQLGCLPGQECVAGPPICVDDTSAQYDGSIFGQTSAIAQQVDLAVQGEAIEDFHSVHVWPTNKFATLSARTVERFSGEHEGSDYAAGHGELLVWGRPGFVGEHGREAQLYLMRHALPIERDDSGAARFTPRYFAGLDAVSGEPLWTDAQGDAEPLALDGKVGGDPHEAVQFTGQMAVSWLPAPVEKWVMLYGGDITDFLMVDAPAVRDPRAPGSIVVRFADHPWGPWTPPVPHLAPGTPDRESALYGPGGLLYHPDCVDSAEQSCVPSDPWRPTDTATACIVPTQALDQGRLYGVNIIDPYTVPNDAGGVDFVWNVSTWNPYAVMLMRTRVVPGQSAPHGDEVADAEGLARVGDFARLPVLEQGRRYRQQSSRDRGTGDTSFPLSGFGNRDFNNFVCKSADAELAADQFAPFHFDEGDCEEDYVRGVVLARFEGPGRLVRTWIGMASLLFGPADEEVLRIYVDDQREPLIEERLADVLDGSAGEIFAPPFGAGSPRRMAWYYPLAFQEKLIVAIDKLGAYDEYFFHCDVVHEDGARFDELATPAQRSRAFAQLAATYHPSGTIYDLVPHETIELEPDAVRTIELKGPATIGELELRTSESGLAALAEVRLSVHWDGAAAPAIDLPLLELFAADGVPPETSSLPLTSFVELDTRVMVLKLPMPYESRARFVLHNEGDADVRLELGLRGRRGVPVHAGEGQALGKLHVVRSRTAAPTSHTEHESFDLQGRGRLAGLCIGVEGEPDPEGGLQTDGLNLLEGDIRIWTDGVLALDGTGTEEYADDVFYFTDAPHSTPFVQAWGVINDPSVQATGRASLCRWHVLGTELDFAESLRASFERGGAGNPEIAVRHQTVAYVYLAD